GLWPVEPHLGLSDLQLLPSSSPPAAGAQALSSAGAREEVPSNSAGVVVQQQRQQPVPTLADRGELGSAEARRQQTVVDTGGRCPPRYGSEGWGCESLRARKPLKPRPQAPHRSGAGPSSFPPAGGLYPM